MRQKCAWYVLCCVCMRVDWCAAGSFFESIIICFCTNHMPVGTGARLLALASW